MGPTEQGLRFSPCHPTCRLGGRGQKYQFLRRSACCRTVGFQAIQPSWILAAHLLDVPTGRSARPGFPVPTPPGRRTVRRWQCRWEPAGAVRLVPPLGLIIYVSASGPPRTWQGLPAVFGNTLCRAPAGPALLPAAGAARPGRSRSPRGLGRWGPQVPAPPGSATSPHALPRICPLCPRAPAT